MNTKASSKDNASGKQLKINERKWTKPLMAAGWTVVPSVMIERQQALGLDAVDINILLHLATYWWTPDNKPHPSKKTLADAMKVTPRTIQRHIAEMELAGLIRREERRIKGAGSKTNLYYFDGLIKAALPFAEEKLEMRRKRSEEDKRRATRKRPALHAV